MDIQSILIDLLKIALGGVVGGGIVAWIEWQRLRRERTEWAEADKKIELRVLEAASQELRWSVEQAREKDEELRLYKSKLDRKLREWIYFAKVTIANTTPNELLILAANLEIPQFEVEKVQLENQYIRPQQVPIQTVHDLFGKQRLLDIDFPIRIPARSSVGFVYLGDWHFDAPNLVQKPPTTATFSLVLGDKSEHKITVPFQEGGSPEIGYAPNGELVWGPHYEKFPQLFRTPQDDEIPF